MEQADDIRGVTLDQLVGFLDLAIQSSERACSAFSLLTWPIRSTGMPSSLYALTDHARVALGLARGAAITGIGPTTRWRSTRYRSLNVCEFPQYFKHLDAACASTGRSYWSARVPGRSRLSKR